MKPNKNVTLVGSSLPRNPAPPLPQLPPGMTPELFRLMKIMEEAAVAQAKTDEKFAKLRSRFLLTNTERESGREKAAGLIRLHQCGLSPSVGKLRRCNCEYITKSDAALLERNGQASWFEDSNSHMQLHVSAIEWDQVWSHREFEHAEKLRASLDKKHARQRQETFERKTAELAKRFLRLLETQQLGSLEESVVLEVLKTGAAIELFTNKIAKYSAKQLVEEYWELVLDLEDMHEEAGIEIVLRDPKQDWKQARADAPKTEAEIRAALAKDPNAIIDVDADISGLSHSSGLTEVRFSKRRASKGEKPLGATKKFESGGFSTTGKTGYDGITNIEDIARHEVNTDGAVIIDTQGRRVTPGGAPPDTDDGADAGE